MIDHVDVWLEYRGVANQSIEQNVDSSCHAYIESLQTCPDKRLAPQTLFRLADTFSNCSINS